MASEVTLPRLGQGMETGTIVRWLKSEGEVVEKGDPLFELDTDKVTQEVEAEASGVLLKIAVTEGEVPVGKTVAFIGSEGEAVPAVSPNAPPTSPSNKVLQADSEPEQRPELAEGAVSEPAPATTANGRIKASPLARRLARERGIELAAIAGTGPEEIGRAHV